MRKKVAATLFITTKAQQEGTKDQQRNDALAYHSIQAAIQQKTWPGLFGTSVPHC